MGRGRIRTGSVGAVHCGAQQSLHCLLNCPQLSHFHHFFRSGSEQLRKERAARDCAICIPRHWAALLPPTERRLPNMNSSLRRRPRHDLHSQRKLVRCRVSCAATLIGDGCGAEHQNRLVQRRSMDRPTWCGVLWDKAACRMVGIGARSGNHSNRRSETSSLIISKQHQSTQRSVHLSCEM